MSVSVRVKLGNPVLLSWARESAGYTVGQMAAYLGKPEDVIVAWEEGTEEPTYRQLEKIANRVKRPLAAFFLPSIPEEPPVPADFRTLPGKREGRYEPRSLIAFREARTALSDIRELLSELELDVVFSLPSFGLEADPEVEAAKVRASLGISIEMQRTHCRDHYQALDMWRDALFDYGVVAMVFRMQMEDARAFCLVQDNLAAVGLNSADAGYARIFSLFHEVCHLCLGQPGVSGGAPETASGGRSAKLKLERYCDQFAAGLLLPADNSAVAAALESVARDHSDESVEEVARAFKVSRYVVLRRALDLGYVDRNAYWSTFSRWRDEEPKTRGSSSGADYVSQQLSHLGKRFAALIFSALDADRISLYGASRLLAMDPRHFAKARRRTFGGVAHAR